MRIPTLAAAFVATAVVAAAGQMPEISAIQRAFEAGQYDQALQATAEARERGEAGGPEDAFLAAHAQLRRSQNEAARGEFNRLVSSGDDIWRLVGESSNALVDQNMDAAFDLANQAAARVNEQAAEGAAQDPARRFRDFAAFYQLGLVKSRREDWAGAAEAFDRAVQLNPSFAYAHYYAGLSYSRIKRPDQVGAHFGTFLKLAPQAPERGAVTSIMRTLRGA